jgi:hypothetical protein
LHTTALFLLKGGTMLQLRLPGMPSRMPTPG